MDEITLDGITFVKATKAASNLGYTADYVGQLCRKGKITAKMIGKTWYVQAGELEQHKNEAYRSNSAVVKRDIQKRIEDVEGSDVLNTNGGLSPQAHWKRLAEAPITYFKDDAEPLIPAAVAQESSTDASTEAEKIKDEEEVAVTPEENHQEIAPKEDEQDSEAVTSVSVRKIDKRVQKHSNRSIPTFGEREHSQQNPLRAVKSPLNYAQVFTASILFFVILAQVFLAASWEYTQSTMQVQFSTVYDNEGIANAYSAFQILK